MISPDITSEGILLIDQQKKNAQVPEFAWQYETNPPVSPLDKALWIGLRPLMKIRAEGKITHWFHWHNLPQDHNYEGILIPGNPEAFSVVSTNPLVEKLKLIGMSLGGWQQYYEIAPDTRKISAETYQQGYRYAFIATGEDKRAQLCSVILHTPIRVLVGPSDFHVLALEARSFNEIPLVINGSFSRRSINPVV